MNLKYEVPTAVGTRWESEQLLNSFWSLSLGDMLTLLRYCSSNQHKHISGTCSQRKPSVKRHLTLQGLSCLTPSWSMDTCLYRSRDGLSHSSLSSYTIGKMYGFMGIWAEPRCWTFNLENPRKQDTNLFWKQKYLQEEWSQYYLFFPTHK